MAQVSDKLRKQLLDQKKEMGSSGMLIANKDWTKGRVRLLPCGDEIPGHRVISYYCESLSGDRKGTTSPATFGLACPIEDAFARLKSEDKEVRDRAYDMVRKTTEYWVPVVVRGEEGTVDAPNVRIFPMKKSVYAKVQSFMTDEDVGEDITHPIEGRDLLIKKQGQQKSTEWMVDKLDPVPLHKDKAMRAAIIEAGKALDVRQHFFGVDYDVLGKIYEALTGEQMPKKYRDAGAKTAAAKAKAKPVEDDDDTAAESSESEESAETPAIEEGSRVSFTDADDNTIEGEVMAIEDETATVKDDDGGEWEVEVGSLTLVESEAAEDGAEASDDGEDGEDGEDAEEAAEEGSEDGEETPEITKGSRVSFDNEGDTVFGVVKKLKGDDATVTDDEGGEWELDVSLLTLADAEDAAEDDAEAEAEEAPPKVTRKAPPKAPAKKPAEDDDPPAPKSGARKPAAPAKPAPKAPAKAPAKPAPKAPAKPAAKAADKVRKAGKK
jgi:hypothetical protein